MTDSDTIVIPQPIDLTGFCGMQPKSRYAIDAPWIHNGWRYASDGAIAVRVPAPGEPDTVPPEGKLLPDECLAEVFASFPACTALLSELAHTKCRTCEGTGQHTCMCATLHTCGVCGGSGKVIAESLIGERWIAARYLVMLVALPDLRISIDGDSDSGMYFVSGELQGMVLPLVDP